MSDFAEFVIESLENFGKVSARKMFGGYGLYHNGVMFALIADDEVYFKVSAENKADYIKENSQPFVYAANGKKATMSYWLLPAHILEDKEEAAIWAKKSFAVALKNKKEKTKKTATKIKQKK